MLRGLLNLAVLVALVVGGLGLYGRQAVEAPGPLIKPAAVTIARGMRTHEIAVELESAGAISNPWVFIAAAYVTGRARQFKAGDYEIPARASMMAIMDIIASGRELVFKLSVPEGWTTAQVLERLAATPELTGDITLTLQEGELLPDTYVFRRGATRDSLITEMKQAQDKLFADIWDSRSAKSPVKTRQEAVILASIVEKETALAEERPRVAAVFANRLARGMRLQSDPTVIYGITGGKEKLERALTRKDLAGETAYNTYRIDGLPPGPISNPGRDSIAAVLNPAETDDLYFVADGTGGHVFASSLDEHQSNVRAWRDYVKAKKAEEAATPAVPATPAAPAKNAKPAKPVKPLISTEPPPPGTQP